MSNLEAELFPCRSNFPHQPSRAVEGEELTPTQRALRGQRGGIVKDYRGIDVVAGMSDFSSQVTQSVEEITQISSRLTEVIQQVQGLPPRFDLILEGMQSQSEGTGQINEVMAQLSQSAQQTANAIKETHRMLDSLRRSSEVLEGEISRFKV